MEDCEKTREQLIEELAELRQNLDALVDYLPEGFFIVESPDMKLRLASRDSLETLGTSQEELEGVRSEGHFAYYQVFRPDGTTVDNSQLPLYRACHYGEVIRNEEWLFQAAGGKRTPILCHAGPVRDQEGAIRGAVISWQDISDRKDAEEALRQSERRFRSLFQDSLVGAAVLTPFGQFIQVNRAFCDFLGYSETELIGQSALSFTHPDDREASAAVYRDSAEAGPRVRHLEKRYVHKNGHVIWGEINSNLIYDTDGTPSYVITQILDITERRRAEAALRAARDELEQRVQDRTAELAAANLQLQSEVEERKQVQEALERERRSLWRMLQASDHERQTISYEIHDGLAQYLAAAVMQFQAHDSSKQSDPGRAKKAYEIALGLVRQSHAEARRLISEVRPPVIDDSGLETAISHLVCEHRRMGGIEIEYSSNVRFGRLPAIMENTLYRIVQEALTNACKHSGSKKVEVVLAQERHNIRLEVRDWGIGFEPDAIGEGHFGVEGIRQRVRLLGGQLAIESAPDAGALVQVIVPLLEQRSEG